VIKAVEEFEIKEGKQIPVIAAGGIYNGEDIYTFLDLGVAGVQMGTRFVATYECDADDAFKQAYIDAKKEDIVIIKSPVGMPGRAIHNAFIDSVNQGKKKPFKCPFHCIKTCKAQESPYCIAVALGNARKGKFKNGFAFAGKNAYRVEGIVSVRELMNELISEYRVASLSRLSLSETEGVLDNRSPVIAARY
jgi:nitronate monooxygenase